MMGVSDGCSPEGEVHMTELPTPRPEGCRKTSPNFRAYSDSSPPFDFSQPLKTCIDNLTPLASYKDNSPPLGVSGGRLSPEEMCRRSPSPSGVLGGSLPFSEAYRTSRPHSQIHDSHSPMSGTLRVSPSPAGTYTASPSPSETCRTSPPPLEKYRASSPRSGMYRESPPLRTYRASPSPSGTYMASTSPSGTYSASPSPSSTHTRSTSPSGAHVGSLLPPSTFSRSPHNPERYWDNSPPSGTSRDTDTPTPEGHFGGSPVPLSANEVQVRGVPDRTASPRGHLSPAVRSSPGPVATSYGCPCHHCLKRDAALKRTLEVDPSVLPPKYKYRHMNPQQADTFGLEPAETSHNRRCTGTQTSFSSFPHDMYPTQRPPDYKLLDLDRVTPPTASPPILDHHHHHGPARHHRIPAMLSAYPGRPSPPTGATHQASPTGATHSVSPTPSSPTEDANATPLNLTTASQHHKHMAQNCSDAGVNAQSHHQRRQQQQSQHRPSVIRQSPYSPGGGGSSGRGSPPRRASPKHGTITPDTDVRLFILPSDPCGTSIDEHFRRSLGGKYPPAVYGVTAPGSPLTASCSSSSPTRSGSPPSPTPAPPAYQLPPEMPAGETTKSNVSIAAGTVDDHFARALGDKWKEINPRPNPPSPPPRQQPAKQLSPPPPKQPSPPPVQLDILAGSVDDHFAKALGDTWLRIKAEKERSEGSNPGSPV